ncbi:MAG: hypothetical protein ABIU63_11945 [Chitinophagaceae bacterium]
MPDNKENPTEQDPLEDMAEGSPPGAVAPDIAPPQPEQVTAIALTQSPEADMEVHHHPHVHHKKKWHDYIFEFFMFFLAVSAGFFVENQREHYVEHLRAKDYAAMLRKDLSADTVIINIIIDFRNGQAKRYDSLRNMINNFPLEKTKQKQFLALSAEMGKYLHLIPNNGTLQQLRSSGALRYFKNTTLVYTLTSYEEDLKHGEYVQAEEQAYFSDQVVPFKLSHFNTRLLEPVPPGVTLQNFPEEMLVNFDKKATMEFYNILERSASFNMMLGQESFTRHKQKAIDLLNMLNNEFH